MKMIREHDPFVQENGFYHLYPRAKKFLNELIEEFNHENNIGIRCWLLELIAEARDPRAFDLFVEQLNSNDNSLRSWAVHGLQQLDTEEARKVLQGSKLQMTNDIPCAAKD